MFPFYKYHFGYCIRTGGGAEKLSTAEEWVKKSEINSTALRAMQSPRKEQRGPAEKVAPRSLW